MTQKKAAKKKSAAKHPRPLYVPIPKPEPAPGATFAAFKKTLNSDLIDRIRDHCCVGSPAAIVGSVDRSAALTIITAFADEVRGLVSPGHRLTGILRKVLTDDILLDVARMKTALIEMDSAKPIKLSKLSAILESEG